MFLFFLQKKKQKTCMLILIECVGKSLEAFFFFPTSTLKKTSNAPSGVLSVNIKMKILSPLLGPISIKRDLNHHLKTLVLLFT